MNLSVLPLLLLLWSPLASSGQIPDIPDRLQRKAQGISEIRIYQKANALPDGQWGDMKECYVYDREGRLTQMLRYDKGKNTGTHSYFYDLSGRKTKELYLSPNNHGFRIEYSYGDFPAPDTQRHFSNGLLRFTLLSYHDGEGRLTRQESFQKADQHSSTRILSYDSQGRIVKSTWLGANLQITQQRETQFKKKGRLSLTFDLIDPKKPLKSETHYDENGRQVYNCIWDEKGQVNSVSEISYGEGKVTLRSIRNPYQVPETTLTSISANVEGWIHQKVEKEHWVPTEGRWLRYKNEKGQVKEERYSEGWDHAGIREFSFLYSYNPEGQLSQKEIRFAEPDAYTSQIRKFDWDAGKVRQIRVLRSRYSPFQSMVHSPDPADKDVFDSLNLSIQWINPNEYLGFMRDTLFSPSNPKRQFTLKTYTPEHIPLGCRDCFVVEDSSVLEKGTHILIRHRLTFYGELRRTALIHRETELDEQGKYLRATYTDSLGRLLYEVNACGDKLCRNYRVMRVRETALKKEFYGVQQFFLEKKLLTEEFDEAGKLKKTGWYSPLRMFLHYPLLFPEYFFPRTGTDYQEIHYQYGATGELNTLELWQGKQVIRKVHFSHDEKSSSLGVIFRPDPGSTTTWQYLHFD